MCIYYHGLSFILRAQFYPVYHYLFYVFFLLAGQTWQGDMHILDVTSVVAAHRKPSRIPIPPSTLLADLACLLAPQGLDLTMGAADAAAAVLARKKGWAKAKEAATAAAAAAVQREKERAACARSSQSLLLLGNGSGSGGPAGGGGSGGSPADGDLNTSINSIPAPLPPDPTLFFGSTLTVPTWAEAIVGRRALSGVGGAPGASDASHWQLGSVEASVTYGANSLRSGLLHPPCDNPHNRRASALDAYRLSLSLADPVAASIAGKIGLLQPTTIPLVAVQPAPLLLPRRHHHLAWQPQGATDLQAGATAVPAWRL